MLMCTILFIFKQKAAYELRISDWSSDVCSSDLAPDDDTSVTRTASTVARSHEGLRQLTQREWEVLTIIAEGATNTEIAERLVWIGRESCRARVCQHVQISVAAVY